MVIDDYDDTREMYAEVLRLEGFSVESASDGQEALQMAVELLPDIIITDLCCSKFGNCFAGVLPPDRRQAPALGLGHNADRGRASSAPLPTARRN